MSRGPKQDRQAEFEEVALPQLDALFNLALSLTRNRAAADDLVQETMLRAYRFFDSFQRGTHIKAWLFRILRNTFINRYRATRARPEEIDFGKIESFYDKVVEETFVADRSGPSPEQVVMNGVVDTELSEAISSLPEEYRTVVILALVEEMSYKEISETLSVPLGTVMSRLHRGRKLLQARLLEYAERKGIIKPPKTVASSGG